MVVALQGEWAPIGAHPPDDAADAHDAPPVADSRLTAIGLACGAADGRRMRAIVQTFHVDTEHRAAVSAGVALATERLTASPHFGGLLCLEQDGVRTLITVIILWSADAMGELLPEVEEAHRHIATATDFGVTTRSHLVLCGVRGQAPVPSMSTLR